MRNECKNQRESIKGVFKHTRKKGTVFVPHTVSYKELKSKKRFCAAHSMRFQAPLCVKEGEETNKRRAVIKNGEGQRCSCNGR
jgi:hypothetical protein